MADKEATVFVIDLGASMGKRSQGRNVTNLDWCMDYVWNKISVKVIAISFSLCVSHFQVLSGRKTDVVGVIGFRTAGTSHQ